MQLADVRIHCIIERSLHTVRSSLSDSGQAKSVPAQAADVIRLYFCCRPFFLPVSVFWSHCPRRLKKGAVEGGEAKIGCAATDLIINAREKLKGQQEAAATQGSCLPARWHLDCPCVLSCLSFFFHCQFTCCRRQIHTLTHSHTVFFASCSIDSLFVVIAIASDLRRNQSIFIRDW